MVYTANVQHIKRDIVQRAKYFTVIKGLHIFNIIFLLLNKFSETLYTLCLLPIENIYITD